MPEKILKCQFDAETSRGGLVQVFTGEGKGKTSAAIGNVMRAVGHGLRVCIIFFMKGDYPYGERNILSKLPDVTIISFGQESFVDPDNITMDQIAQAGEALITARKVMLSANYDMIVLDEINIAAAFNLVSIDDVIRLIQDKPESVELILTGRLADPRIIQMADLVTEMIKIKHPYDEGIMARKGFEY